MNVRAEIVSDAAKRISDTYNLHRIGQPIDSIGKWFAAKLNDGTSDDVLYDSKLDAVTHQRHNELYYAYFQIIPRNMEPREAEGLLRVYRQASKLNIRLADRDHPGGGMDIIKRSTQEDQYNQIAALFGKGRPSNISFRMD